MADKKASVHAAIVVIAVSTVTAMSTAVIYEWSSFLGSLFLACVGLALWTSIIYLLGLRMLGLENRDVGWKALARAMGFAHAPGFLRVFGLAPGLGIPVALVTIVWISLATIVALKAANNDKSIIAVMSVIAISIIPYISVMVFLNLLVLRQVV